MASLNVPVFNIFPRASCVSRKRLLRDSSPCYLALKKKRKLFLKERAKDVCSLHGKKLELFCLEDKQPVCVMCVTSEHHYEPISKGVSSCKAELNTALKPLQEKLKHKQKIKGKFEETAQHIKAQAEHTEHLIKLEFKKLHHFLFDEEEATITELRKEREQKKQMMKEKLEEMNRHISTLSCTIKDTEEMLKANDNVRFLKEFPVSMERVQISQPDPQMPSGALIHVSRYLGNLPFKVWKKMQDIVHYTPVILDPNTANPDLILSDDLTSVRESCEVQNLPKNPERFNSFLCVLGSEGFNSGKHCWDVEVKKCRLWSIGVTTASNIRKGGCFFFQPDVWSVCQKYTIGSGFIVKKDLECVRVDLDCDRGTVSFSDPVTNTHLHTFTTAFNDTVFPFFYCRWFISSPLRILPCSSH